MLKIKLSLMMALVLALNFFMVSCDDDDNDTVVTTRSVYEVIKHSKDHTILLQAIDAAGLASALQATDADITVFAPTNAAFNALPAGTLQNLLDNPTTLLKPILLYHATDDILLSQQLTNGLILEMENDQNAKITVNGSKKYINGALISNPDILGSNGVVHSIDAVLIPPTQSVLDIVVASPDHNTLEAAVNAAGLGSALSNPEATLTLFAPTDAAFAALPDGTLEELLKNPELLTSILLYHALGTEVYSSQLRNSSVKTLNGENVTVKLENGKVFINNAQVTVADILAKNGVVHVINAVLIPPSAK